MFNANTLMVSPIDYIKLHEYLTQFYDGRIELLIINEAIIELVNENEEVESLLIDRQCERRKMGILKSYNYATNKVEDVVYFLITNSTKKEGFPNILKKGVCHLHSISLSEMKDKGLLEEKCPLSKFITNNGDLLSMLNKKMLLKYINDITN